MCAIVGVFGAKKASTVAYYSLFAMQHRGQEATGISSANGEKIKLYKKRGMVADVFSISRKYAMSLSTKVRYFRPIWIPKISSISSPNPKRIHWSTVSKIC